MKMPAIKSQQANGFSKQKLANGYFNGDELKQKLANKKLDLMEREDAEAAAGEANYSTKNATSRRAAEAEAEVFHDTCAQGAGHTANGRQAADDEPIVIYDTQSNTSIAQTAKDQFAAALLRLQAGLDESTSRLGAMEKRLDDLVTKQRQQQQTRDSGRAEAGAAAKRGKWAAFIANGHLNTLMHLSWPVLVFVAMRALERRALIKKLA